MCTQGNSVTQRELAPHLLALLWKKSSIPLRPTLSTEEDLEGKKYSSKIGNKITYMSGRYMGHFAFLKNPFVRNPFVLVSSGCPKAGPQIGWLTQQAFLSFHSGSWKSKIKVSAGLVSSEDHEGRFCPRPLSLACRWLSSLCVSTWSSLWVFLGPNLLPLWGHQS